jgi:hypothetical protein
MGKQGQQIIAYNILPNSSTRRSITPPMCRSPLTRRHRSTDKSVTNTFNSQLPSPTKCPSAIILNFSSLSLTRQQQSTCSLEHQTIISKREAMPVRDQTWATQTGQPTHTQLFSPFQHTKHTHTHSNSSMAFSDRMNSSKIVQSLVDILTQSR